MDILRMTIRQWLTLLVFNITIIKAERINCNYADSHIEKENIYTCNVLNKQIFTGTQVTIEGSDGHHRDHRAIRDVGNFYFEGQNSFNVYLLPKNLSQVFPNLTRLDIPRSNIVSITSDGDNKYHHLTHLYLEDNKISTILSDAFLQFPKIRKINLRNNLISHVETFAFRRFQNQLEQLNLDENLCSYFYDRSGVNIWTMLDNVDNKPCDYRTVHRITNDNQKKMAESLKNLTRFVEDLVVKNRELTEQLNDCNRV